MRPAPLFLFGFVLAACNASKPVQIKADHSPTKLSTLSSLATSRAVVDRPASDSMSLSKDVLARAKNATVLIGDFENGQLTSSGSGVVSEDGLTVLTVRHVVVGTDDRADPLKLVFFSGTDHPRIVQVDASDVRVFDGPLPMDEHYHDKDVAIVKLKAKVAEPLRLGRSEDEEETQPAWSLGFPHGTRVQTDADMPSPTVHSMRIERLERENDAVRVVQLGGSPTHGDSGGPVIDPKGEIVGLMQAKDTDGSIVYAVPTGTVRSLMDAGRSTKLVASEWSKPILPKNDPAVPAKRLKVGVPVTSGPSILSKELVKDSDLAALDPKDLTMLRNEPFARRGYIFKRGELTAMFRKTGWYLPRTHDLAAIQASLSRTESRNVEFIRAYQDATGKRW